MAGADLFSCGFFFGTPLGIPRRTGSSIGFALVNLYPQDHPDQSASQRVGCQPMFLFLKDLRCLFSRAVISFNHI